MTAGLPPAEAVERLARALDPATVAAGWPGRPPRELRVVRVVPLWGEGFVVAYEADGAVWHGMVEADGARAGLARWMRQVRAVRPRQVGPGERPPGFLLVDPPIWLRRAGYDPALPMLGLLRKPRLLAGELLPEDAGAPPGLAARAALLAHRPGKRAVLRVGLFPRDGTAGSLRFVLKGFAGRQRVRRHEEAARALRAAGFDTGRLRVPAVLGRLDRLRASLMQAVAGTPLHEAEGERRVRGHRDAGRALARIHAMAADGRRRHGPEDELSLLDRWLALLARLRPAFAPELGEARRDLGALARFLRPPAKPALLHRDYYPQQLLVSEGATWLVDFDTLAAGDPVLDLGNYLAHLDLARLDGTAGEAEVDAFLRGYGTLGPEMRARLPFWHQAARLRLVCIHGLARGGIAGLAELLDVAGSFELAGR